MTDRIGTTPKATDSDTSATTPVEAPAAVNGGLAAPSVWPRLVGLGAVQAMSQPWGGHGGHGGFGGRHGWHRMDPATMGPRVDFGVDLILGRVQASEEQKTKVGNTIKAILKEAPDFRKGHEEARDQLLKLLKADTFDKGELERLRAERIRSMDEASKKVI